MSGPPMTTEMMQAAIDALAEHGSQTKAAVALGLSRSALQGRLIAAARNGMAPGHFEHGVAPGFLMGKVTVQRAADGTVERTWERQSPDNQKLSEALDAALAGVVGQIVPAAPAKLPAVTYSDLLTLYTFTDFHLGMLAWHKEGGDDWDCQIAEDTGTRAMEALVEGAPKSHTAIVNIQGDFLHYDSLQAITPTHGHLLDADSRFGKIVEVAIRLIRRLVGLALSKHDEVTLLICEGNHDLASALWLRKLFGALYESEPRITVHNSELPYYAIEWGKVMLGFHHGHLRKNGDLPALFAAQYREMWGRCPKVYLHTGHRHHLEVKDQTGARVWQHPTLAARDAYAARGGWWSEREITAITYNARHGQVGTISVTPEMLS